MDELDGAGHTYQNEIISIQADIFQALQPTYNHIASRLSTQPEGFTTRLLALLDTRNLNTYGKCFYYCIRPFFIIDKQES